MSIQDITGIEQAFDQLPYDEKLIVIAKLRSRLDQDSERADEIDRQMAEMAADPDIQREIREIAAETDENAGESRSQLPPDQWFYQNQSPSGVDVSLLRQMRRLTPLQRLVRMEQHALEIQTLLEYGRKHRKAKAAKNR
jgi:hypothetical protein